ncbi:MAG: DUF3795 domain-containing protein [Bacteroidota bacterium]
MRDASSFSSSLIAACGIDCRVCRAHTRAKNPCPGCRGDDARKPKTRVICKIKTCEKIATGRVGYCFECGEFPCGHVLRLDKRYRAKYGTSVVENLLSIQKTGMPSFLKTERARWTCPQCGDILCMHRPQCPSCGYRWLKQTGAG